MLSVVIMRATITLILIIKFGPSYYFSIAGCLLRDRDIKKILIDGFGRLFQIIGWVQDRILRLGTQASTYLQKMANAIIICNLMNMKIIILGPLFRMLVKLNLLRSLKEAVCLEPIIIRCRKLLEIVLRFLLSFLSST
jgi:hypothetical protein